MSEAPVESRELKSTNASPSQSILMFGATGAIGTFIINELTRQLDAGAYKRLAIFTSPSTVENKADTINDLKVRGVEVFVGDVTDKDYIRQVLEGSTSPTNPGQDLTPFDTIISAAGRNAILTQIPILEVADSVDTVKRFYPSEYGTDVEFDPKTSPDEPPHQLKLQVRAFIKSHIKRLEYTYLVTGPYSDMWLYKMPPALEHTGSFDVANKKATVLYDGTQRISLTTMADVAKLLAASLAHPAASRNRALKVNSFTTTPLAVVAEFEAQTSGQKWDVAFTPRAKLVEAERAAWADSASVPFGTAHTLRRIWADGGTLYAERDNGKIGFEGKEETLASQVTKAIKKQTGQ